MTRQEGPHGGSHIGGVSLSSYLQMLEQERKSCTLTVNSGDRQGYFYFDMGELIDARFGDVIGQEAAYAILLWENPVFSVIPPEDRMRRIHLPLAHILLDSARQDDEKGRESVGNKDFEGGVEDSADDPAGPEHSDPSLRRLLQSISSTVGIRHYFLLNRQGKIITQSSRRLKIGDFIAYCIVSGIQMKKVLGVKGPNRIQLILESGETIMIMPGAGMIIGLLLDQFASVDEVSDRLSQIVLNR